MFGITKLSRRSLYNRHNNCVSSTPVDLAHQTETISVTFACYPASHQRRGTKIIHSAPYLSENVSGAISKLTRHYYPSAVFLLRYLSEDSGNRLYSQPRPEAVKNRPLCCRQNILRHAWAWPIAPGLHLLLFAWIMVREVISWKLCNHSYEWDSNGGRFTARLIDHQQMTGPPVSLGSLPRAALERRMANTRTHSTNVGHPRPRRRCHRLSNFNEHLATDRVDCRCQTSRTHSVSWRDGQSKISVWIATIVRWGKCQLRNFRLAYRVM